MRTILWFDRIAVLSAALRGQGVAAHELTRKIGRGTDREYLAAPAEPPRAP